MEVQSHVDIIHSIDVDVVCVLVVLQIYLVDLMFRPGALIKVDTPAAQRYMSFHWSVITNGNFSFTARAARTVARL